MKIISMGALLMDQVALVDRFPKIDDEVFASELKWRGGGSAANTAVFCSRLGLDTGFIGRVGKDVAGDCLFNGMEEEGLNTDGIIRSDDPTGCVYVVVNNEGDRMMFAFSGAANKIKKNEIDLDYLNSFDYLHLACLENLPILEYAAEKFEGRISLGPGALISEKGKEAHNLVSKANMLICSRHELFDIAETKDFDAALKKVHEVGPKLVIVTLGGKGSMVSENGKKYEVDSFNVDVKDTTGAGDAFSAGFLYGQMNNKPTKECLKFANACAALNIQEIGARGGLMNLEQVRKFINERV